MSRFKRALPTRIVGEKKNYAALQYYFDIDTFDELLLSMRKLKAEGYVDFEVYIDAEYMEHVNNRMDVLTHRNLRSNNIPSFFYEPNIHKIGALYSKIREKSSLTRQDVNLAAANLPNEMLYKYVKFKIIKIDPSKLSGVMPLDQTRRKRTRASTSSVAYKGLVCDGPDVKYHGTFISMSYQDRAILRALMGRPGLYISHDELADNAMYPDIFQKDNYPDIKQTCAKSISRLHSKLKPVTGKCIHNSPNDGWKIEL